MLGRRLCRLPVGVPTYFQSSNTFSFREGNFFDISKPKLEQRQKNLSLRRIVFQIRDNYSRVIISPTQTMHHFFRSNDSIWQFLAANHSKVTIYLLDDQASNPLGQFSFGTFLIPGFFSNSPESQPVEEDVGFGLIQRPKGRGCLWKVSRPRKLVVGLVGLMARFSRHKARSSLISGECASNELSCT